MTRESTVAVLLTFGNVFVDRTSKMLRNVVPNNPLTQAYATMWPYDLANAPINWLSAARRIAPAKACLDLTTGLGKLGVKELMRNVAMERPKTPVRLTKARGKTANIGEIPGTVLTVNVVRNTNG